MVGRFLKLMAYKKAPKKTFALRHPVTTFKLMRVRPHLRHAYAPRLSAIGAAAVALPLGMWLGSRRNRDEY
jgi:hypothetical protein